MVIKPNGYYAEWSLSRNPITPNSQSTENRFGHSHYTESQYAEYCFNPKSVRCNGPNGNRWIIKFDIFKENRNWFYWDGVEMCRLKGRQFASFKYRKNPQNCNGFIFMRRVTGLIIFLFNFNGFYRSKVGLSALILQIVVFVIIYIRQCTDVSDSL